MEAKNLKLKQGLSKINPVWLLPVLALIFTFIMIWDNTINRGPKVELKINSADGIVKGTTLLKLRSVPVGRVIDVTLDDEYTNAILTVQMEPNTDDLLAQDSLFWVVKPRVENTGISGLDTLLSGPYIEMMKGKSEQKANVFDILDEPPSTRNNENGLYLTLHSKAGTRLNNNDLITYKGIPVGSVVSSEFDFKEQMLRYRVFIKEPYSALVRQSSRFWISSGIDISFGAEGFKVNTESLDNIIRGGIAFDDLNDNITSVITLKDGDTLPLYKNRDAAELSTLDDAIKYVVMVKDTVGGINISSPVLFKGLYIGKVLQPNFYENNIIDLISDNKYIPVLIALDISDVNSDRVKQVFDAHLRTKTLCANIEPANLLTGEKLISLTYNDKKCKAYTKEYRGYKVIPSTTEGDIKQRVDEILVEVKKFDVKGVSDELIAALKSVNKAMENFSVNSTDLKKDNVIQNINRALNNLSKTVNNYGPDSDIARNLENLSQQIKSLLNDLNPTLDKLSNNPNSIIFGDSTKDIEPKRNK